MNDVDASHLRALKEVHARLHRAGFDWALSGSTALALQDVRVPCADIDVITRASSAFALAASLGGDILQPVTYATRGGIRGYLGRVVVCSVEVDVLGGLEARGSTGTWSRPPILDRFVHRVAIDGAVFPVVRLSYLVGVYRQFGSAETLERIVRATRSQSATTLLPAADLR